MSNSSCEPATAAAQWPATELSVDDCAQHVLLPRLLRLFEDALNAPLKASLRESFNESWLQEAKNCVGSGSEPFVTEADPWDTYVLAQVLNGRAQLLGGQNAQELKNATQQVRWLRSEGDAHGAGLTAGEVQRFVGALEQVLKACSAFRIGLGNICCQKFVIRQERKLRVVPCDRRGRKILKIVWIIRDAR